MRRIIGCSGGVIVAATLLSAASHGAQAAATDWFGDKHASVRLVAAVPTTDSGSAIDAGLEIRMAPGWHAYWRTPGDAGFPPTIDWKGSTNFVGAEITWPAPTRLIVGDLQTFVYPEHVLLPITVMLADPTRALALRASVNYAACAEICVPYHADLSLMLPFGIDMPGDEDTLIAAARALVPKSLADAGLALVSVTVSPIGDDGSLLAVRLHSTSGPFHQPDLFVEGLQRGAAGRPDVKITDDGQIVDLVTPIAGSLASELTAKPLTFTLADGPGRAAEFTATPVHTPSAEGDTR
jgi:suppressor for copper-sensitivity B